MPPPRNQPARSSQRRNSLQDDTPGRTRAGRGAKSAPFRPEQPDAVAPYLSPTATRKTTRSASNISGPSFEAAPDVYASYERPLLMVFGLSPEFFEGLKRHHGKLPKERKIIVSSLPHPDFAPDEEEEDEEEESESEEDSVEESELDEPVVSYATPRGRGRGRGGGRGGRGRGGRGRGRGRGGRPRGSLARAGSPNRGRPSRITGPRGLLTDEDDEGMSNQGSSLPNGDPRIGDNNSGSEDAHEHAIVDDESDNDVESTRNLKTNSSTPDGSPPPQLLDSILDGTYKPAPAPEPGSEPVVKTIKRANMPKTVTTKSGSHTPRATVLTPAEPAVQQLLNPEDDVLSESDLPGPWIENAPHPKEEDCEDRADFLLQTRFKPMVDVQDVIASLTKYTASQRSTQSLYELAANTQRILLAWQDEFLKLDARTAPHMHPAKKAANGGRLPLAPEIYEDQKEADLYGYTYDPKKEPGCQDPWAQRPGAEKNGGRELRTRRNRDMLDSAAPSEEEDEEENENGLPKRQRRATRKFDGTDTGTGGANTPKKNNGWGGARKKGVSRFLNPSSETPEPEGRPAKRARTAASNLLHQRIQAMREESLVPSSGDEDSSAMDVDEYSDSNTKRGRPAGSKNLARRSDFGVKKGPRKKTSEANTPVPSAHGPNAPPVALQSMSEGQGQFSLDPHNPLDDTRSLMAPASIERSAQVTPNTAASREPGPAPATETNPADAYMITAPLSQYTNNYLEDSSPASGSRRKPRVKSEKRSQSMTIWWAERKARKREQDEKNGTPVKTPASRSNSASGRRGGRASGGASIPPPMTPTELQRPPPMHHSEQHPQDPYAMHHQQPPYTAPPPLYMYSSVPPPHPMMLQYSPLAALPSGAYTLSAPPPLNPQYGARALAPAPSSLQQPPSYPSPYGPQSPAGSRDKNSGLPPRSGPPPLAPAPTHHFSPYAPIGIGKPMIPGPPPAEERRGSR